MAGLLTLRSVKMASEAQSRGLEPDLGLERKVAEGGLNALGGGLQSGGSSSLLAGTSALNVGMGVFAASSGNAKASLLAARGRPLVPPMQMLAREGKPDGLFVAGARLFLGTKVISGLKGDEETKKTAEPIELDPTRESLRSESGEKEEVWWYDLELLISVLRAAISVGFAINYTYLFEAGGFKKILRNLARVYHGELGYSLYEDIFQSPNPIRSVPETVSNGFDSYEGQAGRVDVIARDGEYAVSDSGKGMSLAVLMENFIVPKLSGKQVSASVAEPQNGEKDTIGRFGVGFYTTLRHLFDEAGDLLEGAEVRAQTKALSGDPYSLRYRARDQRLKIGLSRGHSAGGQIDGHGTRVSVKGDGIDNESVRRNLLRHFEYTDGGRVLTLNGEKINYYELLRDLGSAGDVRVKLVSSRGNPRVVVKVSDVGVEDYSLGEEGLRDTLLLEFPAVTSHSLMREELKVDKKVGDTFAWLIDLVDRFSDVHEKVRYLNSLGALAKGLESNGRNRSGRSLKEMLRDKMKVITIGHRLYPAEMLAEVDLAFDALAVSGDIMPYDYLQTFSVPPEFRSGRMLEGSGISRDVKLVLSRDIREPYYYDRPRGVMYLSDASYRELDRTVWNAFFKIDDGVMKIDWGLDAQTEKVVLAEKVLTAQPPANIGLVRSTKELELDGKTAEAARFMREQDLSATDIMTLVPYVSTSTLSRARLGDGYLFAVTERRSLSSSEQVLIYERNGKMAKVEVLRGGYYSIHTLNGKVFVVQRDKDMGRARLYEMGDDGKIIFEANDIVIFYGHINVLRNDGHLDIYDPSDLSRPMASFDGVSKITADHGSHKLSDGSEVFPSTDPRIYKFEDGTEVFPLFALGHRFLFLRGTPNNYKLYDYVDRDSAIKVGDAKIFCACSRGPNGYMILYTMSEDENIRYLVHAENPDVVLASGFGSFWTSDFLWRSDEESWSVYNWGNMTRPIFQAPHENGSTVRFVEDSYADHYPNINSYMPETTNETSLFAVLRDGHPTSIYDADGNKISELLATPSVKDWLPYEWRQYPGGYAVVANRYLYNVKMGGQPLFITSNDIEIVDGYLVESDGNYLTNIIYSLDDLAHPVLVIPESGYVRAVYHDGSQLIALLEFNNNFFAYSQSQGFRSLIYKETVLSRDQLHVFLGGRGIQSQSLHRERVVEPEVIFNDNGFLVFEPDNILKLAEPKYQERVRKLKDLRLELSRYAGALFTAADDVWDAFVDDPIRREFLSDLVMPCFAEFARRNPNADAKTLRIMRELVFHYALMVSGDPEPFLKKARRLLNSSVDVDELIRDLTEQRETDLDRAVELYFSTTDGELLLPGEERIGALSSDPILWGSVINQVNSRGLGRFENLLPDVLSTRIEERQILHAVEHLNTGNPYAFVRGLVAAQRTVERSLDVRVDSYENDGRLHVAMVTNVGFSEADILRGWLNPESLLGRALASAINGSDAVRLRSVHDGNEISLQLARDPSGQIMIERELRAGVSEQDSTTIEVRRSSINPLLEAAYLNVYAEALGKYYLGAGRFYLNDKHLNASKPEPLVSQQTDELGMVELYDGLSSRILLGGMMVMEMPERLWDVAAIGPLDEKQGFYLNLDPRVTRLIPSGERFEDHERTIASLQRVLPGMRIQGFLKRIMEHNGGGANLETLPDYYFSDAYSFDYDDGLLHDAEMINKGRYSEVEDYGRYSNERDRLKLMTLLDFIPDPRAKGNYVSLNDLRTRVLAKAGYDELAIPNFARSRVERALLSTATSETRADEIPAEFAGKRWGKGDLPSAYRLYFDLVEDILRQYYEGEVIVGAHTVRSHLFNYALHYDSDGAYYFYRPLGNELMNDVSDLMSILRMKDGEEKKRAFEIYLTKLVGILTHELTHVRLGSVGDSQHDPLFYPTQRALLLGKGAWKINTAGLFERHSQAAAASDDLVVAPWREVMMRDK